MLFARCGGSSSCTQLLSYPCDVHLARRAGLDLGRIRVGQHVDRRFPVLLGRGTTAGVSPRFVRNAIGTRLFASALVDR